ncbi:MAG: hypothetical protein Q4D74_03185 [Comamonadaceae bacterium]|nr:hypothetical protein [Comamonadaceae bacterium]RRD57016.1 hypothetical protein EII20_08450 [Comamonadaceae bacterium OH2545_COT-014]
MPGKLPQSGRKTNVSIQHRGVRSYAWTWQLLLQIVLLLALQWLLLTAVFDAIQTGWQQLLAWAWPGLGLGEASQVRLTTQSLWGLDWLLVEVTTETPLPELWQWWLSVATVVLLTVVSLVLTRERLPLIYLLRALAVLGFISLMLYEFFTSVSSLTLTHMLNDLLKIGAVLLWLLPPLHALVLYIFPLPAGVKIAATLTALLFTAVSVPLQVGAIGWLVQQTSSLMLLPAYMLCTFLPHIAAQLGIYGYFMSLSKAPD